MEANDVIYAEHTGTHIDAPAHTWETGVHVHEIPLQDLIGPAIVMNITQKSLKDSNYLVTVNDFTGEVASYRLPVEYQIYTSILLTPSLYITSHILFNYYAYLYTTYHLLSNVPWIYANEADFLFFK